MKRKKEHAVLLHILFVILVVTGISIMYNNPHYGEGISWLTNETYEDTPEFIRQFKTDIDDIFNYIKYKEVFESNGKLAYDKPVVRVTTGPGEVREYTVDEMVRMAKSMGYYLNEKFKVDGRYTPEEGEQDIRVDWRSYDPDHQDSEPGESYTTMAELAKEVLAHVGNYYAFHYKFIQNPSNLKFRVSFKGDSEAPKLYNNTVIDNPEELKALGRYIYVTGESLYVDTNLNTTLKTISAQLEKSNPYNNSNYYMVVAVNTAYPVQDSYSEAAKSYDHMRLLFIIGLVSLIIGILGSAASLYFMVSMTGHQNSEHDAVVLGRIDRIATETCLILFVVAAMCALFLGEHVGYKVIHLFLSEDRWYYGELAARMVILYAVGMVAAFSMIRRYKAGTLWTGSLTSRICVNISLYIKNHRFTTRLALGYSCYFIFNCVIIATGAFVYFTYDSMESRILTGILVLALLCMDSWVFHQLYKNAWETDQINEALLKISHGDTKYKINAEEFDGKERELAENINHISRGLDTALQEKVRSERLKADLITNVSHDIKTPLTSIVNYVDLIKREHLQDPKIQGYLEVLEQKSQRLKTLTEDLVEASKASSGNLKIELTNIDFVELIYQTNGEFEEKFLVRHLELVSSFPEETVIIQADGRHLWRVLENLYNNAFKYAMEYSRVYVDVIAGDSQVLFTIKNVSENPLNIKGDELTERFVRGDVARTTEGSGLGLSIAKSLTELLGGKFTIYIDGDLFKVQLAFPRQNGKGNS